MQWEEEGEEEEGEEEEIVDEEEEGGGSSEEEEENEEGEEEEAGEEDDESQDVSIRSQNRGNERGELAFELSGILTEGGLCSEKEAAHIVHGRLELQAEEQSIELHPAWIARARRTENKSVDSQAISFSLHRDVRKEEAMGIKALKNRLIFRIDGASSNCVRNAWRRAGGVRSKKAGWNLWWGRPLKYVEYKKLNEFQRVCHFPGTFFLGRKDSLAMGVAKFRRQNGPASFPYLPKTYILPDDRDKLIAEYKEGGRKQAYICKPKASARGMGIRLVSDPEKEIKRGSNCLVQQYLADPLLINSRKFDLRLYVLVTSFDPLRVYLFREGLVRFCTEQYNPNVKKTGKDLYRHLTNYSVNKRNEDFKARDRKSVV